MSTAFKHIDDSFDSKQTESYRLLLHIGAGRLAFSVFYPFKNKFILLAQSTFSEDSLGAAMALHPELYLPYKEVKISIGTAQNCFTLVPQPLFTEDSAAHYLHLHYPISRDWEVLHNPIRFSQAMGVYAAPKNWMSDLRKLFPTARFYHQASSFIDGLIFQFRSLSGKNAFINIQDNAMELVILDNGKLLFYNRFQVKTIADSLYYLLFSFEQTKTIADTARLYVYGSYTTEDIALLKKYISHTEVGNTPTTIDFSKSFDDTARRHYFSLFSLQLCE